MTDHNPTLGDLERGAEEVRLRDLERKGVRRVQVLRPIDIERMIERAVARSLVQGTSDHAELVSASRKTVHARMIEVQALMTAGAAAENALLELRDGHARLERERGLAEERLRQAEIGLAGLAAEAKQLEAEGRDVAEALSRLEKAASEARAAVVRLEPENAELAERLARVEAALGGVGAVGERLAAAERAAAEAEARVEALTARCVSLGIQP